MSWFESDGMRLRAAEPEDVDALFSYLNLPEVFEDRQFGDRVPFPLSRDEISKHLSETSDTGRLFIIEADGAIVGHAAIDWWWDAMQPWCGLAIDPSHRRRGHGRRSAAMILEYLFEQTPAHVVTAEVGEWNSPGLELAQAMGFSKAGAFRKAVKRHGRWQDVITLDLPRGEWEAGHASA